MPALPAAPRRPRRTASILVALSLSLWCCSAQPGGDTPGSGGAAAAEATPGGGVTVTDDAGRVVTLPRPADRVISLVPSGTEMVLALAGREHLVGRTRYDNDPELASIPEVGGGLDPSLEAIVALRPDLVLMWEGEGQSPLRGQLAAAGIPAFALQTTDTADVFASMERLGRLLGREATADSVASRVRAQLDSVRRSVEPLPSPRVLYAVGITPPMTAGEHTFVIELLGVAGGSSVFSDIADGWPTVSLEEIVRRDPDIVLLPVSADPATRLSTLRGTVGWRDLPAVRAGRVATVDADLVNRPGPRLGEAAAALARAIHGLDRE